MPSMLTVASMMPLASPPPCTEPQGHNGWVAGELAEDGCAVPRSGRSCTTSCCPGWPGWYWRCLLWHCRSGSDSCTTTSHAPRYLEQEHRGRLPSGARRKGGSGQPPRSRPGPGLCRRWRALASTCWMDRKTSPSAKLDYLMAPSIEATDATSKGSDRLLARTRRRRLALLLRFSWRRSRGGDGTRCWSGWLAGLDPVRGRRPRRSCGAGRCRLSELLFFHDDYLSTSARLQVTTSNAIEATATRSQEYNRSSCRRLRIMSRWM